jgi:Zn-dependent peptidase ImmA (M78 family)
MWLYIAYLDGTHMQKKTATSGSSEFGFKAFIVHLILDSKVEQALELLSKEFRVAVPRIQVGLPRTHGKVYGCYTSHNETIYVLNSDVLKHPFVILHEFYHHLRTSSVDKRHRGTEKYANVFAEEFIAAYMSQSSLQKPKE